MPNKTIYVKHEDLPLLDSFSGSASSLFSEFLHLKAMAQSNVIDSAGHCLHVDVKRSMVKLGVSYGDTWHCTDCGAEFYHLENLQQGPLTIAEPCATLRDQFAMAAMQADAVQSAIIAAAYIAQGKSFDGDVPKLSAVLKEHYETADAMLEARKQ